MNKGRKEFLFIIIFLVTLMILIAFAAIYVENQQSKKFNQVQNEFLINSTTHAMSSIETIMTSGKKYHSTCF